MIKRLRWKMVGINMAIVTAVLLTVFASVFFISRAGLARESTLALEEALQTGTYDPLTPCLLYTSFCFNVYDLHRLPFLYMVLPVRLKAQ